MKKAHATQVDFFPAALEIQEKPPSPVGRWLLFLLLALFTISTAWAFTGEVDIVVTAPGRVIPVGKVKEVQAPETATVSKIHVYDGDTVSRGDLLISFATVYAAADQHNAAEQMQQAQTELGWRFLFDKWLSGQSNEGAAAGGTAAPREAAASPLLIEAKNEASASLESISRDILAIRAEQQGMAAEVTRAVASLDVLAQRVSAHEALLEKGFGARVRYLELLQQHTDLENSVPVLQFRVENLKETEHALAARYQSTLSAITKNNLMAIRALQGDVSKLERELEKTRHRRTQLTVRAPADGTIEELAVHTVGGVVTSGQNLMKLVPNHGAVEIEALIHNKDIGFLSQGQKAAIKVDTFNFTKYGLIDANVLDISNDATQDEKMGWVYKARLKLARDYIDIGERRVFLHPGMSVSAEVKTGKRRLIEFFLSPLLRYKQESVRER